ncbi:MAG: SDR family oxidoreductase [Gemmobacter sp.]|nr:SDR family oxidoreductase [Gemmobacter sp.]
MDAGLLVLGATGRLGRFLRATWGSEGPAGLPVIWQTRSRDVPPGWLHWRPGQPLPPARTVLVLAGVTAGDATALAENTHIGLAACKAAGTARVLLASSAAVYGAADGADEQCLPAPLRPYGAAKLAMERACLDGLTTPGGAQVTALRIGNVVGADMLGTVVAKGGPVRLDQFSDGTGPVRSYIGPVAFARVIAALATHPQRLPPVLNLAAPQPVAMADLLTAAGIGFDWQPAPPEALPRAVMATDLLQSLVPFAPDDSTATGMIAEWNSLKGSQ